MLQLNDYSYSATFNKISKYSSKPRTITFTGKKGHVYTIVHELNQKELTWDVWVEDITDREISKEKIIPAVSKNKKKKPKK